MQTMTVEGIRAAFAQLRARRKDARAGGRRPLPQRERLADRHQRHARPHQAHVRLPRRQRGLGRPRADAHPRLVYARELEIRNFKPRDYWRVTATFEIAQGRYEGVYQRPNSSAPRTTNTIAWIASGSARWPRPWSPPARAARPRMSPRRRKPAPRPPRLYDLTTLQREANNRFGLPARRTLQIAQALYERHKMITYPRTDSRALPEDYIPTVRETLRNLPGDLAGSRPEGARRRLGAAEPRIFNNEQISDHFAIIPTAHEVKNLDDMEAKLFDMIARRFVAAFYPAAEFDVTTRLSTVAPGHDFKTEGKVLTAPAGSPSTARPRSTTTPPTTRPCRRFPPPTAPRPAPPRSKPPPLRNHQAAAALHGSHAALRHGRRGQAGRRRGTRRGDEGTRPRHARHPRRHHRRPDQPEVHRPPAARAHPTAKAEQLIQFLSAVKAEELTKPDLTGEWEFKLRQMEHGKFPARSSWTKSRATTKGIVERVKAFEEDDSIARVTDIPSPTDGKPLRETLRGYKSQDGEFMVYKVIGGRRMEEQEVRQLVTAGQIGPLDGFISAKTRARFSALLKLVKDAETGKMARPSTISATRSTSATVDAVLVRPEDRRADLCEVGNELHAARARRRSRAWKQTFRIGRLMCQKPITRENAIQLIGDGKTDLIKGFISKKGRPFDAFLKREGPNSRGSFPRASRRSTRTASRSPARPRPPRPLEGTVLGRASSTRRRDRRHRRGVSTCAARTRTIASSSRSKKSSAGSEIPAEEVLRSVRRGSHRPDPRLHVEARQPFSAYLVLSPTGAKAEFEFPPR
jgi:DNA topoisomerase-3